MTTYYNAPRYSVEVVVEPTVEPVTLEEAMDHLNVDLDDRHLDAWLTRNIPAARQNCQGNLGRSLAPQTLEIVFGGESPATTVPAYWQAPALNPWAANSHYIELPFGPVTAIESVTYMDTGGIETVMDDAEYELHRDTLMLASGSTWPALQNRRNALAIRYLAGYTLPEDELPYPLPEALHNAILMELTYLESGDEKAKQAAKYSMEQYRLRLGMA